MKRTIFYIFAIAACLWMLPGKAGAQILDRGLSLSSMPSFTQKGTWMVGGTGSWTVHRNDNYRGMETGELSGFTSMMSAM